MGNCSSSEAVTSVNDGVAPEPVEQQPSTRPAPLPGCPEEQRTITSGNTLRASRQGESLSNPSAAMGANRDPQQRPQLNGSVVPNPLAGQVSRLSVTNLAVNLSSSKPRNSEERQRVWVLRPSLVDNDDADDDPMADRTALTSTNLLNMRLKQKTEVRTNAEGSSKRIHQWLADNAKSHSGFRPASLEESRSSQDVCLNK